MSRFLRSALGIAAVTLLAACAAEEVPEGASVGSAVVSDPTDENDLTIFLLPRINASGDLEPLDYGSPSRLIRSLGRNDEVGHALVELRCKKSEAMPKGYDVFQGQSGGDTMAADVKTGGLGFGLLFKSYPGVRQSGSSRFDSRTSDGKASFIRYRISDAMCGRLASYLDEYNEKKHYEHYGLLNQPRQRQGAGCTGFGVGFLEVAGLITPEYESAWRQTLHVPKDLIGDPDKGVKVDPATVVVLRHSWAAEGTGEKAVFWEPNLMHQWVVAKMADVRREARPGMKIVRFSSQKTVEGVEIDARTARVPTEALFEVPAGEGFEGGTGGSTQSRAVDDIEPGAVL